MLVGSPIEAELAMDTYLAGLLTCASAVRTTFPENSYSSGLDQFSERCVVEAVTRRNTNSQAAQVVRISALTVAGQWRHLTALPFARWRSYSPYHAGVSTRTAAMLESSGRSVQKKQEAKRDTWPLESSDLTQDQN
jgi:hypothetical protein